MQNRLKWKPLNVHLNQQAVKLSFLQEETNNTQFVEWEIPTYPKEGISPKGMTSVFDGKMESDGHENLN